VAGPEDALSVMRTVVPLGAGRSSSSIRAVPVGHARACSTSLPPGSISTTSVVSSMSNGQSPTLWCSLLPTAGNAGSTARMCAAPTTHSG